MHELREEDYLLEITYSCLHLESDAKTVNTVLPNLTLGEYFGLTMCVVKLCTLFLRITFLLRITYSRKKVKRTIIHLRAGYFLSDGLRY